MCGIFSIVNFNGEDVSEELLGVMSEKMLHRGPDDDGILINGNIGIGMRRLSIIDIEGGQQPISNETNDIHIVLNGEIYNYKELRRELIKQGHKFRSNSDVEVLVHLYEEYGCNLIDKLNGMFAFVLYDQKNNTLWVARDRFGIKPLFYYFDENCLVLASDLTSVNSVAKQEIDKYSVMLFLGHSYIPAPKTIYKNISKLMPGEQININNNSFKISKYWDIENLSEENIGKIEAADRLRKTLGESVKFQTRSDVPVGLFLSGGVDSATIAAITKEVRPKSQFHTFTVDFIDKKSQDSLYAANMSSKINSIHHLIKVTHANQIDALNRLIKKMDEPMSDSAIVPTFIISEKARDLGVKVMLTGAGGDEIFGGYARHHQRKFGSAAWLSALPKFIKGFLFLPFYFFNKSLFWRLSNPQNNFLFSISGVNVELLRQCAKNKKHYKVLLESFLESFKDSKSSDSYSKMKLDVKNYLHNNVLSLTDKATMAASVEGRVPLLDHHLAELSFKIPEQINLLNGVEKSLFKYSVKDLISKDIMDRKKDGFNAPVYSWIESWKELIKQEISFNITPELNEVIDVKVVERWLNDNNLRSQSAETLYSIYILNLWIRKHRI